MNFCFIPPLSSFRSFIFIIPAQLCSFSMSFYVCPLFSDSPVPSTATFPPCCSQAPSFTSCLGGSQPSCCVLWQQLLPGACLSEDGLARQQLDTTCWHHEAIASAPRMRFLWHQLLQISLDISLQLLSTLGHTHTLSLLHALAQQETQSWERHLSHLPGLVWDDLGALASTSLFVKWDKDVSCPGYPASNVLCSD